MDLLATATLAVALAASAGAAEPAPDARKAVSADTDRMSARDFDQRARLSNTFPNERHRLYGTQSAAKGQWGDAMRQFRQAARHADKYSQHRISLMYWHGVGVERDPALAYAWADLAAERMYPSFVLLREKMWQELADADRERALREGATLYAEYGDKVAKPRLEKAMLRSRGRVTGSRTGNADGRLQVYAPTGGGTRMMNSAGALDLNPMYADWRLDPARYWAVEDAIWSHGSVDVGPALPAGHPAD